MSWVYNYVSLKIFLKIKVKKWSAIPFTALNKPIRGKKKRQDKNYYYCALFPISAL